MFPPIERSILLPASPATAWQALTDPAQLRQWMGEPEMDLEVLTDWTVGGPLLIRGELHGRFENRGTVLAFEPHRLLRYSHQSSFSRLPDAPESASVLTFRLEPAGEHTTLTLTIDGFPTESIYRHLDFYWRGTLGVLAAFVATRRLAVLAPRNTLHG